jgi:hypothetical protein
MAGRCCSCMGNYLRHFHLRWETRCFFKWTLWNHVFPHEILEFLSFCFSRPQLWPLLPFDQTATSFAGDRTASGMIPGDRGEQYFAILPTTTQAYVPQNCVVSTVSWPQFHGMNIVLFCRCVVFFNDNCCYPARKVIWCSTCMAKSSVFNFQSAVYSCNAGCSIAMFDSQRIYI